MGGTSRSLRTLPTLLARLELFIYECVRYVAPSIEVVLLEAHTFFILKCFSFVCFFFIIFLFLVITRLKNFLKIKLKKRL